MTSRNADGKPQPQAAHKMKNCRNLAFCRPCLDTAAKLKALDTRKTRTATVEMAACDNCGHRCPADDLGEYKDFWSRVTVGGIVPAGDCPKCGAFAYVEDETRRNLEAYAGLVSALKRANQEHERGSQVCARQIIADGLRAVGEEV